MHIKQITVNGFKAFADKETIVFDKGICALVGPNGSGKSNVIDAIKWVIGEQKISELRGEKLEDLIFNGSQKFKPQNFAEVDILFDNSEKKFSVSYDDLMVTRRMYRSGESEFFINKQDCRLKDIQDIFLNSGLGKSSYAIIPQGKIDQVLSEKADEKRKWFEEAAAIAKFRERKREYDAKILKAQENLTRVDDLLKQHYRRRSQLSKQSGDTAKYFEINDRIKEIKINLILHDIFLNREQEEGVKNRIEENLKKLSKIGEQVKQIEANIEDLSSALNSDSQDIKELEMEKVKSEQKKNSFLQEKKWFEDGLQDTERAEKTLEENLVRIEQEIAQNQSKITQNQKQIETDKKKILTAEEKIQSLKKSAEETDKQLQTLERENEILTDILSRKEKERAEVNEAQQKILVQLIAEIDSLKKDLQKKNIIASRDVFSKKVNDLIADIQSIDTGKLSEPVMIAKVIEIQNRTAADRGFFKDFFDEEKNFYTFFFSAEGTYSTKEKLTQELHSILEEIQATRTRFDQNRAEINTARKTREDLYLAIEQEKFNLSGYEQVVISLENDIVEKQKAIDSVKEMLTQLTLEKEYHFNKKKDFQEKLANSDMSLTALEKANQETEKKINDFFQKQKDKREKFEQSIKQKAEIEKESENLEKENHELTTKLTILEHERESHYEKGSYQCGSDLRQLEVKKLDQVEQARKELSRCENELQTLGTVNPLAKDEFDEVNLKIEEMEGQKKDILDSIVDLETVTQETVNECKKIFLETFEEVNQNFSMLVKELFPGGEGIITLSDKEDPLSADIAISVQPQGKKFQKLNLFSGGERTLIVLAFIFAFFLRKPSPFCLLDEVDAALDSSNIERFMRLLKEMQKYTQVILISHNQKTMQIVDYIYGFSIKDGVTRVMSLKV